MKIWIGQSAFRRLDDKTSQILLQEIRKDRFLLPNPVAGKCNLHLEALFGKNAFDSLYDPGKYVIVYIGGHYGNAPALFLLLRLPIRHIGAAALAASDKALLLQKIQCIANGLTAYLKVILKLILRRKLISRMINALCDFLPQGFCQHLIFCHMVPVPLLFNLYLLL